MPFNVRFASANNTPANASAATITSIVVAGVTRASTPACHSVNDAPTTSGGSPKRDRRPHTLIVAPMHHTIGTC
jgi:hypothetical protein